MEVSAILLGVLGQTQIGVQVAEAECLHEPEQAVVLPDGGVRQYGFVAHRLPVTDHVIQLQQTHNSIKTHTQCDNGDSPEATPFLSSPRD